MSDDTQVLEFALGPERYCVDIDHVAEVVARSGDEITPVPNSARHVMGVIDLRGSTTTLVDPKRLFGIDGQASGGDGATEGSRPVIVFDDDQRDTNEASGWIVDEVYRVDRIDSTNVDTSTDDESIEGIVNRDGEFLIWTRLEAGTA